MRLEPGGRPRPDPRELVAHQPRRPDSPETASTEFHPQVLTLRRSYGVMLIVAGAFLRSEGKLGSR